EGKLSPRQQDKVPPLDAKPSGHATISFTLAVGAAAGGEGAGAAGAPSGTPAAASPAGGPVDPLLAAKALAAQGKFDEAETAIKALAAADPTAKSEFELAKLYHTAEKSGEERASLLRVLAKDASYP